MRSERLVALLFTLQNRRSATAAELAETLGVSERTMHRDIAALREAGVPVWTEPGRHGGIRLVEGWRSRLDGLTSREAVALFAMGAPRALAELGLGAAVSAAHAKVAAGLPAGLREQAQQVAQRFHLDAPAWFRREDETGQLATVARAVWEQHRLGVRYRRGERTADRLLEPLGIVLKAGVWYLVARVPDADAIRTYRVSRIAEAQPRADRFDRPHGFDLPSWWQQASARFERALLRERARLRLSPSGLRALPAVTDTDVAVEAIDQAEPPAEDGWTELELPVESHDVALSQLLSLGAEVEILEPVSLRTAFAEVATAMATRHGQR